MLTLALVIGGSVMASELHVSAPIAMVVAGLIIGNLGRNKAMNGPAIRVDNRCHTSMRNVWAIGDLTGEPKAGCQSHRC